MNWISNIFNGGNSNKVELDNHNNNYNNIMQPITNEQMILQNHLPKLNFLIVK